MCPSLGAYVAMVFDDANQPSWIVVLSIFCFLVLLTVVLFARARAAGVPGDNFTGYYVEQISLAEWNAKINTNPFLQSAAARMFRHENQEALGILSKALPFRRAKDSLLQRVRENQEDIFMNDDSPEELALFASPDYQYYEQQEAEVYARYQRLSFGTTGMACRFCRRSRTSLGTARALHANKIPKSFAESVLLCVVCALYAARGTTSASFGYFQKTANHVQTLILSVIILRAVMRRVVPNLVNKLSPREIFGVLFQPCTLCLTVVMISLHLVKEHTDNFATLPMHKLVTQFQDINVFFSFGDVLYAFLPAFLHSDGLHLLSNLSHMRSFTRIEKEKGVRAFTRTIVDLTIFTKTVHVLAVWFVKQTPYTSVGFSGVICAGVSGLSWYQSWGSPTMQWDVIRVFSISLCPGVSFLGHCSGVCVGLAYAKLTT